MPPSPSSRRSPVRELSVENSHKRDHSFGSRFPRKAKDDDLVLFNEMQNHERDNFLLLSSDDFDESISKMRYFSDFNLGISIPARGESSDLLNADCEKTDYDWLLTPPDTPLFPSLDDAVSQHVNVSRSRARSPPISISRMSTCEKIPRTNRTSASPHRVSPSARSSYSAAHSSARSSSAPHTSPPPIVRQRSPSPRPSTPTKASPPAQRSLTPTLRRMSTGSSGQTVTGRRGTSPVKTPRGNSASPKLRGWQTNLPGFSTDAPPNLRTSPTDQTVSRTRGLSPASSTGRGFTPKFGRLSVSPSSSRSAMSSHNSEGDPFSAISKQSAASSCEDEIESHASIGISPNTATRNYRDFTNSKTMGLSQKPSRPASARSAPKRTFDLGLRQTDHRKAPQNMFRPLLSSVPSTTFHSGQTNTVLRPIFSRNSSVTTSSNASTEHGASVVPDSEDCDHDQSDLGGEWYKSKVPEFLEEVFAFDKLDEISEDVGIDTCPAKLQSGIETFDESIKNVDTKLYYSTADAVAKVAACQGSSDAAEVSKIDSNENMCTCSDPRNQIITCMDVDVCEECSRSYQLVSLEELPLQFVTKDIDYVEEVRICSNCGKTLIDTDSVVDVDLCQKCYATYKLLASEEPEATQAASQDDQNNTLNHEMQSQIVMPELCESRNEVNSSQREPASEIRATHFSMDIGVHLTGTAKSGKTVSKQEMVKPLEMNAREYEFPQSLQTPGVNDKVDNAEGTGIAVLLRNMSGTRKWPVMRGKVISATNILFSGSHGGDDMDAVKRDHATDGSASSSIDLGSSGQTESHILHQLNGRTSGTDNMRGESHVSARLDSEKLSATTPVCPKIGSEEFSSFILKDVEENMTRDVPRPQKEFGDTDMSTSDHISSQQAVECIVSCCDGVSSPSSDLLVGQGNGLEMHRSSSENNPGGSCDSHRINDKVLGIEAPAAIQSTTLTEDAYLLSMDCQDDVCNTAAYSSPIVTMDQQDDVDSYQDASNDYPSAQTPNCSVDLQDGCSFTSIDKTALNSELDTNIPADPSPAEEPTKIVDSPRKHVQRSFTLEEATDTILFCSSIVHDIAYKAATIAVEKELALYESSHPPVSFMGSVVSNHKDLRKAPGKHAQNPRKLKRKKAETADKVSFVELPNNVKNSDFATYNDEDEVSKTVDNTKPPKLESKCNCTVM